MVTGSAHPVAVGDTKKNGAPAVKGAPFQVRDMGVSTATLV